MRAKSRKIPIEIRARLKVQPDSLEAMLHEYLNDEDATRYLRSQLILESLITYFLPLVYEYRGATTAEIRKSLVDVNKSWQLHFRYLQQRLDIDLNSAPPTVPVDSRSEKKHRNVSSEAQVIHTTEEVPVVEEEEEEDYCHVFK